MTILRVADGLKRKNVAFLAGVLLAGMSLCGVAAFGMDKISAATCSGNNIIGCGFTSPSGFIDTVRANNNGINSTPDLQAIYAHYGLTSAEYDIFAAHAVQGEAMRDGQIIVDGKVVATGGMSIGRTESYQGSNPFTVRIGDYDYFGNVNSQVFASGVNEIPVYALLSPTGTFQFAVMPACGNPEIPSSVVQTNAACQVLNETPVEGQANAYTFTASATQTGNASIVKYVYNFGDGSPSVTEASGSIPVNHIYATPGTYTATVTVFASVPGNSDLQLPAISMCAKQITISPPPAPTSQATPTALCQQLVGTPQDDNRMAYVFTATTGQTSEGSTLTSADFTFGDGNTQSGILPNSGGVTSTASHAYSSAGTYTATATLHFSGPDGWKSSPTCSAVVTVSMPPAAAAPTTTMPDTGAGDVIGIFLGTFIISTLGYRLFQHRKLSRSETLK
jgi:hypothetical protein